MQIVAKVIDFEISKRDLDRESAKFFAQNQEKAVLQALNLLIDRCLLFAKALQEGIKITEEEYDNALLDIIEQDEPLGLASSAIQELTGHELETLLRRQLIIKKYINTFCPKDIPITTKKLHDFYEEQKEFFKRPPQVHCSHILIKGDSESMLAKATQIRANILNAQDFLRLSQSYSDCPSNASCGDLGWFAKGKMISEIDEVAFSMKIGEISQPFKSNYGYHILMLLERKEQELIPFEEIRESLYARLQQLEKEYLLSKHLAELRHQFADSIIIYAQELTPA